MQKLSAEALCHQEAVSTICSTLFQAAQPPSQLLEPVLQVQKLSEKHAAQLEAFHYAIEMRRPCRPKYSKDLLNQRKVGRCPLLTSIVLSHQPGGAVRTEQLQPSAVQGTARFSIEVVAIWQIHLIVDGVFNFSDAANQTLYGQSRRVQSQRAVSCPSADHTLCTCTAQQVWLR